EPSPKRRHGGIPQKMVMSSDITLKTQEFGIIRKDGAIRTYFKPDPKVHRMKTNEDYFRQEVNR
ncbi:MAG TPA: hypothetical protein VEA60_13215, partial [Allosphingosinicella sp.]|nr:hypothetical protein [Allosphingosinicella sp.]